MKLPMPARCGKVDARSPRHQNAQGRYAEFERSIACMRAYRQTPVASVKGHLGHSGASSGAMAVITGLLGMDEGRFTFTANTDEPDPAADFDIVIEKPREMKLETLQVNAFGFGGQNASVIVTRQ